MQTLYDDFKGNKDFVMLAVSQDTKGRAASRAVRRQERVSLQQFCSIRRTRSARLTM